MLEQVEKKIEELKKTQAREYYRKKDADLDAWGLTTKKDGKKSIPIIVTNEEYEALIQAANGVGESSRNKTARFLSILALITLILGAISGGVILAVCENMGFVYFSLAVAVAGILAAILKGISEAISLLQQIIDSKPIETPEISEEELEIEDAPIADSVQQQYAAQYAPVQQPAPVVDYTQPPVYQAQPPIYQAQPQQGVPVQAYPPVPPYGYAPQAPALREDLAEVYANVQNTSNEPQAF